MHMQARHCNDLIEKTAAELNDNIIALMLLSVQRANLELSVKSALNQWVFLLNDSEWVIVSNNLNKHYSVHYSAELEAKGAKDMVQECLRPFPNIWASF